MNQSEPVLVYLADDSTVAVSPFNRIGGLWIAERVLRAAARAGYSRVLVWAPESAARFARLARQASVRLDVAVAAHGAAWRTHLHGSRDTAVTVIGPGTVVAPALLESALRVQAIAGQITDVPAGEGWPSSGVYRVLMDDLTAPVQTLHRLRGRRETIDRMPPGELVAAGGAMLTLPMRAARDLPIAERMLRQSIFKPTDGVLARFNRRLSLPISIALMRTPVTANQISIALIALAVLAAWLFSKGTYGAGVVAAMISLAASILDGCDGEVARLKYQESALGCWIETFGDYFYYIAVFIGMAVGAVRDTRMPVFGAIGLIALAGMFLTFLLLILLRQRITQGRPERLQATAKAHFYGTGRKWTAFMADLAVCGTRSTMPYGIALFALAGWLPAIVVLCAIGANVYWISLAVEYRALLSQSVTRPPEPSLSGSE